MRVHCSELRNEWEVKMARVGSAFNKLIWEQKGQSLEVTKAGRD